MDYISNLPNGIIESILCLVPIKEAARTSILSKEWRYKWTRLPKLVFDADIVKEPLDWDDNISPSIQWRDWRLRVIKAINQVMLMHQGPIHEFKLTLGFQDLEPDENCVTIDQIIRQLSKDNTTETKLAIDLDLCCFYKLQLSLIPLHQLVDLKLSRCHLVLQPETFKGFSRLTNLFLENVCTTPETLIHLVATCPLLKSFTLDIHSENLHDIDDSTHITDLFKFLPVVENLTILFDFREWFDPYRVPKKLPTALVHLKHLWVSMGSVVGLYGVGLLIRNSPNLVKLRLYIWYPIITDESTWIDSLLLEACSGIYLKYLNELAIDGFSISKTEIAFLKLLLAKSPALKKLIIYYIHDDNKEALKISSILLSSPRASTEVEISVESR